MVATADTAKSLARGFVKFERPYSSIKCPHSTSHRLSVGCNNRRGIVRGASTIPFGSRLIAVSSSPRPCPCHPSRSHRQSRNTPCRGPRGSSWIKLALALPILAYIASSSRYLRQSSAEKERLLTGLAHMATKSRRTNPRRGLSVIEAAQTPHLLLLRRL